MEPLRSWDLEQLVVLWNQGRSLMLVVGESVYPGLMPHDAIRSLDLLGAAETGVPITVIDVQKVHEIFVNAIAKDEKHKTQTPPESGAEE